MQIRGTVPLLRKKRKLSLQEFELSKFPSLGKTPQHPFLYKLLGLSNYVRPLNYQAQPGRVPQ